ncbi:MAG: two-component system histidine kinase PnpS, partial [Bacilli bacterium]
RRRVLWLLGIVAVTIFISLGVVIGQLFERYYSEYFSKRLQSETALITEIVRQHDLTDETERLKVEQYVQKLGSGILFFDGEGRLLMQFNASSLVVDEARTELAPLIARSDGKSPIVLLQNQRHVGFFMEPTSLAPGTTTYVVLAISLDAYHGFSNQLWIILSVCMGVAFLLVLILGIRIIHRFTKPIEDATEVAIELANGNYRARTYERFDETGNLSRSINKLARNLETMTNQTEMQNQRLLTIVENIGSSLLLIDERGIVQYANRQFLKNMQGNEERLINQLYYRGIAQKEIVRTIEEIFMTETNVDRDLTINIGIDRRHFHIYGSPILGSREEWKGIVLVFHDITNLKRLENMRKDFLANVSHELKTPITSIKGFSETLLDGALEDAMLCEQFLRIILKESDRMTELIGELLELSKIEQPDFSLDVAQVNVHELIEDTVAVIQPRIEGKNQSLVITQDVEHLMYADYNRMQQILLNLLANAVNYSQEGSIVTLRAFERKDVMRFEVSDNGPGITEKEIPRIFERFYRLDKAPSRNSGGTGLGLSIVKHLVDAHKGHIECESEIGVGTTFSVEIPRVVR